jgi:hypothetical protein
MIQFDPPTDEQMTELEAKHGGDLRVVEDGDRVFVLGKPEGKLRGYVDRFVTTAANERKRLEATEQLVKACCVHPDKETLKRVLDDEPGLALSLADPGGVKNLVSGASHGRRAHDVDHEERV